MKKKIIIPVVVIIILLVIGLVYMNKSQESSLTPIPTETPAPTATPTPTPEPTPTATPVNADSLEYEFDLYVETYKYDNGVTDEDLRNNQDTRYAMYEWIYLSGYTHWDAEEEQEEGCTHEFIADYIQYGYDRNTGKLDTPENTDNSDDHKLTSEEVANMTPEERRQYIQDTMRETGAVGSLDELDGVTAEETKDFMDETWNVDNPYIKDIIDSGVLDN